MVGSTMLQEVEAIPGGKGAERYTAWQVVLCLLYHLHRTSRSLQRTPRKGSAALCGTLLRSTSVSALGREGAEAMVADVNDDADADVDA